MMTYKCGTVTPAAGTIGHAPTLWAYNRSNLSISAAGEGRCIDIQNGDGPDVDIWHCKHAPDRGSPGAVADALKQRFRCGH